MRLIDADALLEVVKGIGNRPLPDVRTLEDLEQAIINTYHAILTEITNAPTIEIAKLFEDYKAPEPLPVITLTHEQLNTPYGLNNAPTIQREGWVSVPAKLHYDEMRQVIVNYFERARKGECLLFDDFWEGILSAVPDTE